MTRYACALCGKSVEVAGEPPRHYPFCSPRCQLVDLGKWLYGGYAIERDLAPEERTDMPNALPPNDADRRH